MKASRTDLKGYCVPFSFCLMLLDVDDMMLLLASSSVAVFSFHGRGQEGETDRLIETESNTATSVCVF